MTLSADLDTPAVTILLDRLEANIARVQAIDRHGIGNRPHIKTHKIPAIAQDADGGRRRSASPARSSARSRSSSMPASPTTSCSPSTSSASAKTDRLMELSSRVKRLAVVADNETVVRGLSEAGVRHGRDVPLLIECDTGFGRNGVQTPGGGAARSPASP